MESQSIVEVLRDITNRLNYLEAKIGTSQTTINNIVHSRNESLERYRVAYNRQHGLPDGMIHPPNPEAEDEIG